MQQEKLTEAPFNSRMVSIWASRLAAAVLVLAGPVLFVYGRSDIGPWSSIRENLLWSVPWAFFASAAAGYAVVKGLLGKTPALPRTLLAILCVFVALPILFGIFLPLLFGLGVACNVWAAAVILPLMTAPAAALQVFILRSRTSRPVIEFFAYLAVSCGAILLGAAFVPGARCGDLPNYQIDMFQSWPILFATIPLAILAMREAAPVSAGRLILAAALALSPLYLTKAALDLHRTGNWNAALWPANVWTDFIGAHERNALFKKVTTIYPGVPVRIGEHWYQFQNIGFQNPMRGNERRPDRINAIQLDIPADDLDLRDLIITGQHIQLNIGTLHPGQSVTDSPSTVQTAFTDLTISVVLPRGREIDREDVRRKLLRFMQNAQVR
jgi:hypothetical protein